MGESFLSHREYESSLRRSPFLWFILIFIPFANLYFVWKIAENIAGHEKRGADYSYLDLREEAQEAEFSDEPAHIVHKDEGVSIKKWFAYWDSVCR